MYDQTNGRFPRPHGTMAGPYGEVLAALPAAPVVLHWRVHLPSGHYVTAPTAGVPTAIDPAGPAAGGGHGGGLGAVVDSRHIRLK